MARKRFPVSPALVACAALLVACGSKTPLEQLEESRGLYKATLNSVFVRQVPLVEEVPEAEMPEAEMPEEGAAPEEAASAAAEDAAAEPIPVPTRQDAELDVIVQHDAYEPLQGVTLDITLVDDPDGAQVEIGRWLRWVDTSGLPKANQKPFFIVIEDVPYQEGYGFNVEVRSPIPAAERSGYREYDGL